MRTLKTKSASAVAILEQFTCDDPIHERNASNRVFADVTRTWPVEHRRRWWTWFAEASNGLRICYEILAKHERLSAGGIY